MKDWIQMILTCICVIALLLAVLFPKKFTELTTNREGKVIIQEPSKEQMNSYLVYRKLGKVEDRATIYELEQDGIKYILADYGGGLAICPKPAK